MPFTLSLSLSVCLSVGCDYGGKGKDSGIQRQGQMGQILACPSLSSLWLSVCGLRPGGKGKDRYRQRQGQRSHRTNLVQHFLVHCLSCPQPSTQANYAPQCFNPSRTELVAAAPPDTHLDDTLHDLPSSCLTRDDLPSSCPPQVQRQRHTETRSEGQILACLSLSVSGCLSVG